MKQNNNMSGISNIGCGGIANISEVTFSKLSQISAMVALQMSVVSDS
jgi:hypothetical protein